MEKYDNANLVERFEDEIQSMRDDGYELDEIFWSLNTVYDRYDGSEELNEALGWV
jgi:hypothetical protein